jgi:hypothetical protein
VTSSDEPPTGREIRAEGVDARVEIMRYRKLRLNSNAGRVYEFILIVMPPEGGNFLLQVGNSVPADAVRLVVPGRNLPAKLLERDRRAVLIDWPAALAEDLVAEQQGRAQPGDVGDGGKPEGSTSVS